MYNQLCLIRDLEIGEDQIENFEIIMLNKFGVRVKYHTEIKTFPTLDEEGYPIPRTGGRNDLFFYVHKEDIDKFSVPRMHLGVHWWEDVVANTANHDSYPEGFIKVHPPTW